MGVIVGRRAPGGRDPEVHGGPAPAGIVGWPWPPPSPPPSSRARSTCCCSWSTATRWTSSTSPWPRWSTPSWPRWPRWESVDLQTLSEFLVIAAVLIELKSRRLLPGPDDVDPDEELIGWEERDLLLARLLECQAYAAAADAFALLIEQAARSVPRTAGLDDDFVVDAPDLLEGVTPDAGGRRLPAGHRRAAGPGGRPLPRDRRHGHRGRRGGRAEPAAAGPRAGPPSGRSPAT